MAYVRQGTHKTTGGYVDTLDFNVQENAAGDQSQVRIFSVSNIHGALGDNGQNYKTLSTIRDALAKGADLNIVHGCGSKVM